MAQKNKKEPRNWTITIACSTAGLTIAILAYLFFSSDWSYAYSNPYGVVTLLITTGTVWALLEAAIKGRKSSLYILYDWFTGITFP